MKPLILLVLVWARTNAACDHANVCETFPDYYTTFLDLNPHCFCNPDVYRDDTEMIAGHGYPVEVHRAVTPDGYILTMFRIPGGKHATGNITGPPIFIQHGFLLNSRIFYFRGNSSLAFVLADQGYDVWLGNFRGTRHSDKHLVLDNTQRAYWNFSYHELGIYDVPTMVGYVSNVTQQKIFYIGYSLGTTSFFVYSCLFPDIAARNVRLAISLAPIASFRYIRAPLKYVFPLWPLAEALLYTITNGPIVERGPLTQLLTVLCLPYPFQMKFCNLIFALLFGYDEVQLSPPLQPIIMQQLFDESSIKLFGHYVQSYFTREFRYYDYKEKNMAVYGQPMPPLYPLQRTKVQNYFTRGDNDLVAPKRNVEYLYASLPPRARSFPIYEINLKSFSHTDFVAAKDIMELLYNHIVNFLDKNGRSFT